MMVVPKLIYKLYFAWIIFVTKTWIIAPVPI